MTGRKNKKIQGRKNLRRFLTAGVCFLLVSFFLTGGVLAQDEGKEIHRLLDSAMDNLSEGRYTSAQEDARKVLVFEEDNLVAKEILEDAAKEKAEADLKRQAEEYARRMIREEKPTPVPVDRNARKRAEQVTTYLEQAQKAADAQEFDKARKYAQKASEADPENPAAVQMLDNLQAAEAIFTAEQAHQTEEEEKRKMLKDARAEAEEQAQKERVTAQKVSHYVAKSREYLSRGDYNNARKYAYKAQVESPTDSETLTLLTDIAQEELFGPREKEAVSQAKGVQKAIEEDQKRGDPFHSHDEPKGWIDHIKDIFTPRKFSLGEVREGKVYTIDECVNIAMNRSQRKIMADQQVKLAEMRVWETRRDLFPEITAVAELSEGKVGGNNYQRHYRGQNYKVEVKQTVFDGMGTWFELRQSQTNLDIVKLEREKILNEIVEDTKKAYYSLDKTNKALVMQMRNQETVERFYGMMEKAHEDELVSTVNYLNVKGQNLQADFQLTSAEEDVKLAKMILFQVMNMEPEEAINIKPVERPQEKLSIGLENCYELALANRPDFNVKKKTIEYYDFERKMMKAKGWPKIDFHGSFGAAKENYRPLFLDADHTSDLSGSPNRAGRVFEPEWFAGVKGSWSFFGNTLEYNYVKEKWAPTVSSFRGSESITSYYTVKFLDDLKYFSNLQESKVGFERAKYEYLKAKKDLLVEVKELYFKFRKALLLMDVADAKYVHQQMYLDVLTERLRFGEWDIPKIVEEYNKLIESEHAVIAGDSDYYISLIQLNQAIGISDYFKPGYENTEYKEWVDARDTRNDAEKYANARLVEEEMVQVNSEKISDYLFRAQREIDKNRFAQARKYVNRALELDENSSSAAEMLDRIDEAEAVDNEAREQEEETENIAAQEKAIVNQAEEYARRMIKEEKLHRQRQDIVQGALEVSREALKRGDVEKAREYAGKALSIDPDNAEAQQLMDKADKAASGKQ
ncbi:MAG: TolC family protein [Candidatus Tantalella remota]|nr:TolC family protein [Candidatus Tantalella remota]